MITSGACSSSFSKTNRCWCFFFWYLIFWHSTIPSSTGFSIPAKVLVSLLYCPLHPPPLLPNSWTLLLLHSGSYKLKPGRIPVTWCPRVWCLAWTPLHSGNALGLFPTLLFRLWRAGHYNPIQLPSRSIPDWFKPLPDSEFPQTTRIRCNFNPAGALGIKLWTTEAVYGRTEEFELHNRQLPVPLIPPPLHSICGLTVGGFFRAQIKNSQPIPDTNWRDMEHILHRRYLPLWWTVWEFLIAFSEAGCHRKIPLQSTEKTSWWAVRKQHRYSVNVDVNTFV